MATIIECPKCKKKLKIGDEAAGTRVRCPACQFRFTAPGIAADATDTDLEPPSQRVSAGDPTELEENEEPDEGNEEPDEREEEEDERPRKRRRKSRRSVKRSDPGTDPSVLPLVLSIGACFVGFFCCPLGGAIMAWYAMNRAADAMGQVHEGTGAWTRLNAARIIGIVAYVLCVISFVLGVIMTILNGIGGAKQLH